MIPLSSHTSLALRALNLTYPLLYSNLWKLPKSRILSDLGILLILPQPASLRPSQSMTPPLVGVPALLPVNFQAVVACETAGLTCLRE